MKRERIDTSIEQKLVTAMVVDSMFLAQAIGIIDVDLIQANHLQQIAKWCIKYHARYRQAPNQAIESIYHSWVTKTKAPEEVVDAIHDVLEHLSQCYEEDQKLNVPYLIDMAVEYFSKRRVSVLKDDLEYYLQEGDINAASSTIATFINVSAATGVGIDPLDNEEAWDAAFSEAQDPLIRWGSKDADYFFGSALTRDALIAVLAPEKRGKTWWCLEFAMRALAQRRRVALFEVGDMSQGQILKRMAVRLTGRPLYHKNLGEIRIPRKIVKNGEGELEVRCKLKDCEKTVNAGVAKQAVDKFLRRNGMKKGDPHLMLGVYPNSAVNVAGLEATLEQWEAQSGFIPDVVIIDYPDILAPEPSANGMSSRDTVNETWKALRRMSQERHCLVIAPTQADAASYDKETLGATNFSEDKRKLAHVTGMLGLNQACGDKENQVMRLNWIALREGDFNPNFKLLVGYCYTLGKAFTCSSF